MRFHIVALPHTQVTKEFASARAKLVTGQPLTEEEAGVLVL
jgi:hypothetical protein